MSKFQLYCRGRVNLISEWKEAVVIILVQVLVLFNFGKEGQIGSEAEFGN